MSGYVLETEGVSFRYEKKDPLALDGVSVRIKKGVKTAITGPTERANPRCSGF